MKLYGDYGQPYSSHVVLFLQNMGAQPPVYGPELAPSATSFSLWSSPWVHGDPWLP